MESVLAKGRILFERLADFCWPRTCPCKECGRPSDRVRRYVCSSCFSGFSFYEAGGACSVCGIPVPSGDRHDFVCDHCLANPPKYDLARSGCRYEGAVCDVLQAFKYGGEQCLGEDLADILEGAVRAKTDWHAIDLVVPIPLHPNRYRDRGYNQSGILAEILAGRLNRKYAENVVLRVKDTEKQALMSGDDRRTNIRGAFAAAKGGFVKGRTVLLVDDVMTTGSTMSECAQVLKNAGARRVWCATVARAELSGK